MVEVFLLHDEEQQAAVLRQLVSSSSDFSLVNESQKGRDSLTAIASIPPEDPVF